MRLYKAKERQESAQEKWLRWSRQVIDYAICLYLLLMLMLFPFYNEEGYSHIGTDKATFFRGVSVNTGKVMAVLLLIYLILWIMVFVKNKTKFCPKFFLTDFFALFYCAALLLSYACTEYKEVGLWGEDGWFMGLMQQLILMGIYFLVSRFWMPRKWMFYAVLPVSGLVFLMGCLNRFNEYSFGMEFVNTSFISTIGNINWYCGYAVSVVFIGVVLLWTEERLKPWQKTALMLYTVVGYLSLVLQGSDSGLVVLIVVTIVMFAMSVKNSSRMFVFWQEMTLLWGGCLGLFLIRLVAPDAINFMGSLEELFISAPVSIGMTALSAFFLYLVWMDRKGGRYREKLFLFLAGTVTAGSTLIVLGIPLLTVLNTLYPEFLGGVLNRPLFTFNSTWGSSRGATWRAGWECFAAQDTIHKLVGVGPDGMWSHIASMKSPELWDYVMETFGGSRLTNAHCEWLTILVNMGVMGLIGYAGMVICGMRELFRKGRENSIAMAGAFCLLAYTVNHIFSFQQSMSIGTIFVLFAMSCAYARKSK